MNKSQLTELVIKPTLQKIPNGYSEEALMAVEMIIAHESQRGEYIKQTNGPALGLIQMEPQTHNSTWRFADTIWENALFMGIITEEQRDKKLHPKPERLLYDLAYNVFMARQMLFMKLEKLPKHPAGMSRYLKEHWNTIKGAATDYSYLEDWKMWR